MNPPFKVGITRDFLAGDGSLSYGDIGLSILEQTPNLNFEFLEADTPELTPSQIRDYNGLLVLAPKLTVASLEGNDQLRIIARFGVGYDTVDVPACTENGTLLTITPKAVRRPVAVSALTFLLSLSHKLLIKDHLTRSGNWNQRLNHMGIGLKNRTLGVIGVGNIGQEVFHVASNLEMNFIGYDPHTKQEDVEDLGVQLLLLDDVMKQADYLVICCTLVSETHHLINAKRLALMKPSAFLINVSRGPVVDEIALHEALKDKQIQGAGLDVFEQEPIDSNNPILSLENVILAPHSLCWTDQFFEAIGYEACQCIADVANGIQPSGIVNRGALKHERLGLRESP
jgi:D-3-phosphoglycerate dehydrogenase